MAATCYTRLSRIGVSLAYLLFSFLKVYGQDYVTKRYTVNDGLPTSSINYAYEDTQGYLWIATTSGLSRFDGIKFKNYGLANGLPSIHITAIMEDKSKRLWIGTIEGPAQLMGERLITYPYSDDQNINYTFSIAETRDRQVWAFTDKGVYLFNDSIWKKISLYPGMDNSPCRNIVETTEGIYINYGTVLVKKTQQNTWKVIGKPQIKEAIFNVLTKAGQQLYISTLYNIYLLKNDSLVKIFQANIPTKALINFTVDNKRHLWLYYYEKGIQLLTGRHYDSVIMTIPRQYEFLVSLYVDSHENIWACTTNGLLKIKKVAFSFPADRNKYTEGLRNVVPFRDGRLLLSNNNQGILLYDRKRIIPLPQPLSHIGKKDSRYLFDLIDDYAYDVNDQPWLITRYRKLYHFDGKKLRDFSHTLHRKTHEYLYNIIQDKRTGQFLISGDSILLEGNEKGFSPFIPSNTGKPVIRPTRMCQASNGDILIYIEKAGLYKINTRRQLIPLVKESGITRSCAKIYMDTQNHLWIAVAGLGLYYFNYSNEGNITLLEHFTENEGLQSNSIHDVLADKYNRLWVASEAGLDILGNEDKKRVIYNYSKDNQLQLPTWWDTKLAKDGNGDIWLSSLHQLIQFNTGAVSLRKHVPMLAIEKVLLDRKETNWHLFTDSLFSYSQIPVKPVLDHTHNSLSISFNGISFSDNPFVEYAHRLDPIDKDWSDPSPSNFVSLINLPAGHYDFRIKTRDKASGWSEAAVFSFTINPPFWQTWWFLTGVLLLSVLIIRLLYRNHTKNIRHKSAIHHQLRELEVKALKSQMNPHFVYNSLNSIQALISEGKQDDAIRYIGSFSRLLRQILHYSESLVIPLDKELENLKFYIELEKLRLNMDLDFSLTIDESVLPEKETNPPLIIQPFIENALWHGLSTKQRDRKLLLKINADEQWLICTVEDNGIGRKANENKDSDLLHQSKGVEITQNRLLDYNESNQEPIVYTDLIDNVGNGIGTRVDLFIRRKSDHAHSI